MDTKINARGRLITDFFEEHAFMLLNGKTREDTPACFTFCGPKGNSIVDLVFCNFDYLRCVTDLRVSPLVTQSDHLSVLLSIDILQDTGLSRDGRSSAWGCKWEGRLGEKFAERMTWHPNI